jgi:hypothetical protein
MRLIRSDGALRVETVDVVEPPLDRGVHQAPELRIVPVGELDHHRQCRVDQPAQVAEALGAVGPRSWSVLGQNYLAGVADRLGERVPRFARDNRVSHFPQ